MYIHKRRKIFYLLSLIGCTVVTLLLTATLSATEVKNNPTASSAHKMINVIEFGALGDGRSDDAPAIQKAVNASQAGDTVYFPAGIYQLGTGIQLKSEVSYIGEGLSTVLTQTGQNFPNALFNLHAQQNMQQIYLKDLYFKGKAESASHGLYLTNLFNSELNNIWIEGFGHTGLYIDNLSGLPGNTNWIKDVHIIKNGGNGFYINNNYTDIHLFRCDIGLNQYTNVEMNAYSSSVRDCTVYASSLGHGITITSDSVQIYNNQIEGNAAHGLLIQGSFIHIQGNKIYDNANNSQNTGAYDGIAVEGKPEKILKGITITYNMIYSGLYPGTGIHRYQISFNEFHENASILGNGLKYNGNGEVDQQRPLLNGLKPTDEYDSKQEIRI